MIKRTALRSFLWPAALAAAVLVVWPLDPSTAQQRPQTNTAPPPPTFVPRGGVGGTSLTLSDVWGPAVMPPTPKDFGPHFDFQPEALSGGLNHDPYPN